MGLNELFLILGGIFASAGVVSAFRSSGSGAVWSFFGVNALMRSHYAVISERLMIFWAIAVIMVLLIGFSSRRQAAVPDLWKNYIVGGALAGMVVGMIYGQAGMITGSAAGAIFGGVACGRIKGGQINMLALRRAVVAVGLPSVVTMSILGTGVLGILQK